MKKSWNFALVEIWSSCRCDMKIIFGAFDKVDIKLLSHKIFFHHMHYKFLQNALKLKSAKKISKKIFKKSSNSIPFTIFYHNYALLGVFLSLQKSNPCFTLKKSIKCYGREIFGKSIGNWWKCLIRMHEFLIKFIENSVRIWLIFIHFE